MPRISKLPRSTTHNDFASITPISFLDFLLPAFQYPPISLSGHASITRSYHASNRNADARQLKSFFFSALSHAATCPAHRAQQNIGLQKTPTRFWSNTSFCKSPRLTRD